MKEIEIFVNRLKKININVELIGNYPWIYLDKVNGKKITRRFEGNHGFTIAFLPVNRNSNLRFTDITEIFNEIRKAL